MQDYQGLVYFQHSSTCLEFQNRCTQNKNNAFYLQFQRQGGSSLLINTLEFSSANVCAAALKSEGRENIFKLKSVI